MFFYGSLSDIFYVLKKEYGLDEIYMISFFKGIAKSNKYECLSLSDKYLEITCSYVENEISNNKKADLEDASQYFCALENKCDTIVTNDKNFPKLDITLKRTNPNLEDYNPL